MLRAGGICEGMNRTAPGRGNPRFAAVGAWISRSSPINWALADQVVVSGTNFLTTILVARFLGPEELGRFTLAWLGLFFAQNLQIALVISPMMTIGAKMAPVERPSYVGAVLVQQAVVAIATTGLVLLAAIGAAYAVPDWHLAGLAGAVTLAVLAAQGAEFMRRYYFTFGRPHVSFAIDLIRYGGQSVLLVVMFVVLREDASTVSVYWVTAGMAAVATLAGVPLLGAVRFTSAAIRSVTLRHWRFGRWLLPNVIAVSARENFFYAAVGAVLGLAEVGALRAAHQLVLVVNIPLHGFANVVPMRAAAAYASQGYSGLVQFVLSFVLRYQAAVALILVSIALFSEFLITSVYGELYAGRGELVEILALIMLLLLARSTVSIMLYAMEQTSAEFFAAIAATLCIAATAYPLVLAFGTAGAMASAFLYEAAFLLVAAVGLARRRAQTLAGGAGSP
jgi:O-antigen/teichoic acid export membrane protein